MVTNIAMTTRGVNVLFHSVSPVVSHPASVHGGGSHLTDHGARRTEPSSIHGGRAVHGGAGRPTPTGPAGRGRPGRPWESGGQARPTPSEPRPGRPRGSGSSGASRARSGSAAGTAGAAPRIRRPGPWPGHWHRPRRELPRHPLGGSRRCRPTRPWRAPAARHTPGRVELTMSPQLALCELSSHELSSGGFCQAQLTSCEPGWILLSRPGRLFWDRPSGAGGTPGATRVGVVSKSATKALRAGIGRGGNRGISTILFRCFGSIRAFVADLDNWRRRGPRGEGVARLGEVHDVNTGADTRAEGGRGPGGYPVRPRRPRPSAARPARRRPGPRDRHLTHENVPLADDLAGYPAISAVK